MRNEILSADLQKTAEETVENVSKALKVMAAYDQPHS
jgi:hypothetical protein